MAFTEITADLSEALARDGYLIRENFFSEQFSSQVREEIKREQACGSFRPASVGKAGPAGERELHPEIRRDGTLWFEPASLSPVQARLWNFLEDLKIEWNRSLFLGLWDFEGHYAIYPPGAFYRKHVDRFQNDSKRTVSAVFFFNENWRPEEGGALVLELPEGVREVLPRSGTAVFFLSDRISHEVRETFRERMSFAGWFRTR